MLSLVGVVAGAKMVHDDVLMDVVMLCLDDLLGEFRDGKLSVFVHSARLRPMSENSWTLRDEERWRSIDVAGRRAAITITTRRARGLTDAERVVHTVDVLCVRLKWRDWTANAAAIQQLSCSTRSSAAAVGPVGGARARGTPADNSCAPLWHGSGPPPRSRTCTDLQPHVTAVFQNVCCDGKFFYCADPVRTNEMLDLGRTSLCRPLPHSFYIVSCETWQTIFRFEGNDFLDFYIATASLYTIKSLLSYR